MKNLPWNSKIIIIKRLFLSSTSYDYSPRLRNTIDFQAENKQELKACSKILKYLNFKVIFNYLLYLVIVNFFIYIIFSWIRVCVHFYITIKSLKNKFFLFLIFFTKHELVQKVLIEMFEKNANQSKIKSSNLLASLIMHRILGI